VKGRKRHILVDTVGLLIRVICLPADIQDWDGAEDLFLVSKPICPRLELIWADSAYHAHQVDAAFAKQPDLRIEIVKRSDDMKGFVVLPRRWVVERTFSWFGRNRRLAKDFEATIDSARASSTPLPSSCSCAVWHALHDFRNRL